MYIAEQELSVLDTLKAAFPNNQVQLRNQKPTLWLTEEVSPAELSTLVAVGLVHKVGPHLKRSNNRLRVTFK